MASGVAFYTVSRCSGPGHTSAGPLSSIRWAADREAFNRHAFALSESSALEG